jgi:uncharacterized protein
LRRQSESHRLIDASPDLERILTRGGDARVHFAVSAIKCETTYVPMRDGTRLATDLYLPPKLPAPVIVMRTPYGRAVDRHVGAFFSMARRGYVVVSQDCRGTGDSEPDTWDYYMYEPEDGLDLVEWVTRQSWFDGFVGACGGSYVGQTQWCMARHARMSTIVPEVSGLGFATNTAHLYMNLQAYARSVGKGTNKVSLHYTELERLIAGVTIRGGYFNEPLQPTFSEPLLSRYPTLREMPPNQARRWLWEQYCRLTCAERVAFVKEVMGTDNVSIVEVEALSALFGQEISHDAHTVPHADRSELCRSLHAPVLMITGWYDWGINDALATWEMLTREATESVRTRSRLIITPAAHNTPGYHEGVEYHPELQHNHRLPNHVELLLRWYAAVREGNKADWPRVIYYMLGANEWRTAPAWPVPEAQPVALYLFAGGALSARSPPAACPPDCYVYDPEQPTPTVGGSIVSSVYPPGSVDVAAVQARADVVSYTTAILTRDLDVVGPLRLILYASSSAVDTDFSARVSDVFPDGRAIQLQSGILRARHRNANGAPELLEPARVYRLEIDLWATANLFKAGHRLRLDISSADFPRYDRNTNRGGEPGPPVRADQTLYHDAERPSHLLLSVLDRHAIPET